MYEGILCIYSLRVASKVGGKNRSAEHLSCFAILMQRLDVSRIFNSFFPRNLFKWRCISKYLSRFRLHERREGLTMVFLTLRIIEYNNLFYFERVCWIRVSIFLVVVVKLGEVRLGWVNMLVSEMRMGRGLERQWYEEDYGKAWYIFILGKI